MVKMTDFTSSKKYNYKFFDHVQEADEDAIIDLANRFEEDTSPSKVNLGVGIYRHEDGKPYVFECVKEAEVILAEQLKNGETDKNYVPIDGTEDFQENARAAIFGEDDPDVYSECVYTAQTLSSTGAHRTLGEFFKKYHDSPIYLSSPTWGSHRSIFENCGLEVREYRYYDPETKSIDMKGLLTDLGEAPEGAIIMLSTCAHNPTGVDPTLE